MAYKTVPLNESQVGKYVDIDGDGIPEGVIFADLAVGGEGQWGNEYFKGRTAGKAGKCHCAGKTGGKADV